MIIYPNNAETFTIDDFRIDRSEKTAEYYLHVVNDKTGICRRIGSYYNFDEAMKRFNELSSECANSWHIELTVGISGPELRARLK